MKMQSIAVALLAVAGLTLATGSPQAAQFKLQTNGLTIQANPNIQVARHVSCKVWGTPPEFPSFVLLTNDGHIAIPAGTKIHWQLKNGARAGNFTFPRTLAVGKSIYAPEPGGYARGAVCDVSFTTPPLQRQKPNNLTVNTNHPVLILAPLHVRCFASGPVEFPDRVVFSNDGPRTIPAGTRVHWAFNSQVQGIYKFVQPLAHGKFAAANLSPSPGGNAKCSVNFLK